MKPDRTLPILSCCLFLLSAGTASGQAADAARKTPAGKDYANRPFVTQSAPNLRFERRLFPRPEGIDYPFTEQTAQGVVLFRRFPPFTLSDRRIHVSGPWYGDPQANLHFSRGINTIEAMPNYRLDDSAPTTVRSLPQTRKWQLMTDPLFWGYAARLVTELEKENPQDERLPALRAFAVDHVFTPHEAAFRALGRRVWQGERWPTDAKGQGILYPSIDIELTGGWEHQRNCFGWLYQGMVEEAAVHGDRIVPITYGQWTFSVGTVHQSMRPGGAGEPEYLRPDQDFIAASDPTLKTVNDLGGVLSMDGYMQAIWGREPFYRRNSDGTLQVADGRPVFSDRTTTTLYGQEVALEPGEAEHCLQDLYRQATRMYLMYHRLAGQYPARSDMRKSFLSNVRIGAWTRITNEGLQGIQQNDRPLPGWLLDMLTGLYLFTADDIVMWSSDFNTPSGPAGADYRKTWKYNAHGVLEYIIKAAHRYSTLEPLHRGPFRWCWFRLPMVDRNQADGERYDQKPLVFGKLRTFEGKPWLEMWVAYPALDGQAAEMKVWVEKAGKRSPAYTLRLKDGRSYFYDAWQLPAGFRDLEGRDVRLRFRDLQGVTRTWRGDWREAMDETTSTPASYRPPARRSKETTKERTSKS